MHEPVLLEEALAYLAAKEGGCYVDGTAGGGGHTAALLEAVGGSGRVLAVDRDADAVRRLRNRFGDDHRCSVIHGNFSDLQACIEPLGVTGVDGILLDLGVSSFQLDDGGRGFSFSQTGPLDMRMNQADETTAEDLLAEMSEEQLANVFYRYGEIRGSRRLARAVVAARKDRGIKTTTDLAQVAERVFGRGGTRIHPATRLFQALRIAVNDELGSLERGLERGLALLAPGGRLAVIAFHSLEDRIVKHCFRSHAGRWESLPEGGQRRVGEQPAVTILTKKPVVPTPEEQSRNPRSRSAKLRVVERAKEEGVSCE